MDREVTAYRRVLCLVFITVLAMPVSIPRTERVEAATAPNTEVTNIGLNASHNAVQPNETVAPPLRRAWHVDLGGELGNPIVADGGVFVGATAVEGWDKGALVYGFDIANGAPLWDPVFLPEVYEPALTFTEGRLFALSYEGRLFALDAKTGTEMWAVTLSDQWPTFRSPPVAFGGRVYVGGHDGPDVIYAVEASTGVVAWSRQVPIGMQYPLAVDATGVYVGGECQQIRISLSGDEIWANPPPNHCYDTFDEPIRLIGDELYVSRAYGVDVYAKSDGTLLRTEKVSVCCMVDGLTLGFDYAFAARDSSGTTLWRNALRTYPGIRGPSIAAGYAFFGHLDGTISAIDLRTGRTVWSTQVVEGDYPSYDIAVHDLSVGHGRVIVPIETQLFVYEPVPVSIRGPARALNGSSVSVITHSDPGSTVEIYGKGAGQSGYSLLAVRTADVTGRATARIGILGDTTYFAESGGIKSSSQATDAIPRVAIPSNVPDTRASNYQIGPSHTGAQSGETLSPPLERIWSYKFPGRVSYPISFGGRVFVVTERSMLEGWEDPGTRVYALKASTGESSGDRSTSTVPTGSPRPSAMEIGSTSSMKANEGTRSRRSIQRLAMSGGRSAPESTSMFRQHCVTGSCT
jgi:outer membrane protein assembly factor BamB